MESHMKSVVKATAIAVMFLPAIACQTVKMPKIDLIKLPEFRDALESPSDYPDVADAPAAPSDVRSDAQWDRAAKEIILTRDGFVVPDNSGQEKSDAEIAQDIDALKAEVRAYKADDPS